MTAFLPPNLLRLFEPREPIKYMPPYDKLPHEKNRPAYQGLAGFLAGFEDPKDTPLPVEVETREQRRERKRKEKAELQAYKIEQGIALWNPAENPSATTDPYKSLFVGRINYETSESKLRREFERYGKIKRIVSVYDKTTNKPRGYAFIEFEHEKDMHRAYKSADGMKIDGRRVVVDVERGRTVKGWLPRRFGGGLGKTRLPKGPGGMDMEEWERIQARERGEPSPPRTRSRDRDSRDRDRDRRDRDRGDSSSRRSRDRDRDRGDRDRGDRRERDRDRGEKRRSRSRSRDRDRKRPREDDRDRKSSRDVKREPKDEPPVDNDGGERERNGNSH